MTIHYSLIQYVEDPVRNEGRNIGVIVHDRGVTCLRALGVSNGQLDVSYFEALSTRTKGNGWVYQEWISWFEDLLSNEGRHLEGFQRYTKRLEGGNFIVKSGGYLDDLPEKKQKSTIAEYLFANLVTPPHPRQSTRFTTLVEDLVTQTKLPLRPDFDRDITVEFFPEGRAPVSVSLPFILTDTPRTIFKIINPNGNLATLTRQVNDALYTFETVVAADFATKERCIIITDRPGKEKAPHLRRLATNAHLIMISDPMAVTRIAKIIATGTAPQGDGPLPLL